jgi:hypothetical protein
MSTTTRVSMCPRMIMSCSRCGIRRRLTGLRESTEAWQSTQGCGMRLGSAPVESLILASE